MSIDELVDLTCRVAGKTLKKTHDLSKPQGVRGRNSDNRLARRILGWEPTFPLEKGLAITYPWIENELVKSGRLRAPRAVHAD